MIAIKLNARPVAATLVAILISSFSPASIAGGDDGNGTIANADPVVVPNGVLHSTSTSLSASMSDGLCRDVDFFLISNLAPLCDYTVGVNQAPFPGPVDARVGWFDVFGDLILTDPARINLVADINGQAYVAITATGDQDFDGLDDATSLPHGACFGYTLWIDKNQDGDSVFAAAETVDVSGGDCAATTTDLGSATCDGACHDVDYFLFENLTPLGDYTFQIKSQSPSGFRIGWFDKSGALILSQLSEISLVGDANGQALVAVTGAGDGDFDGLNDATTQPHENCGAYTLTIVDDPDGNGDFGSAFTVESNNGNWATIDSDLVMSNTCGPECRDVDYFIFTNLIPLCDYELRIDAVTPIDFRIGWFDLSGSQILSGIGVIGLVADINGEALIAVTGQSDHDFDGYDDATMLPHGVCATYTLSAGDEPDGNDTFETSEPVNAANGACSIINSDLALSTGCFGGCLDVDFYLYHNLAPLDDYTFRIGAAAPDDFRIGWFDLSGALILSDTGTIDLISDINGEILIAITGDHDADFDGLHDTTLNPHGVCGDYALLLTDDPDPDGDSAFETANTIDVNNDLCANTMAALEPGCDGFCYDVDFFLLDNLIPLCDYMIRIKSVSAPEIRIGWHDKNGALILSELREITFIADANGQTLMGVSASNDANFDGFDDLTTLPHGLCAAYALDLRITDSHGSAILFEDLNQDGIVDTADLGILIAAFSSGDCVADINGDGVVDTADLGLLINSFGA